MYKLSEIFFSKFVIIKNKGMKKIIITVITFACIFLYGCNKRQYTCECTITGGPPSDFIITDTQKNAIKKCATYSSSSAGTATTTCAIK